MSYQFAKRINASMQEAGAEVDAITLQQYRDMSHTEKRMYLQQHPHSKFKEALQQRIDDENAVERKKQQKASMEVDAITYEQFTDMSDIERKTYLTRHPHSKFAKEHERRTEEQRRADVQKMNRSRAAKAGQKNRGK